MTEIHDDQIQETVDCYL